MSELKHPVTRRADLIGVGLLVAGGALFLPPLLRPLAAQTQDERAKLLQQSCLANLKQVSLGMLMYVQDYDEKSPLAGKVPDDGGNMVLKKPRKYLEWPDLIFPYVKNLAAFRCPAVTTKQSPVTYLYNDLLTARVAASVESPSATILLTDGEDVTPNVGHAWMKDYPPAPAVIGPKSRVAAGAGARLQSAPTRHTGGANYAFADGHVKLYEPGKVYFPPRSSNAVVAASVKGAPKPGGAKMTFHLQSDGPEPIQKD